MFCPKCGTQNPETGKFCRQCGADLGNVSAALSGNLPVPQNAVDRRGRPVCYESAITKIFTGLAFLIVSIILGVTGMMGAKVWWFWLLIPAFGTLGSGLAQLFQLKKMEQRQNVAFTTPRRNTIASAPENNALPPTAADYVSPPKQSIYETGDLAPAPSSVTEETTRHLQMDSEGETMTLPKK